MPPPGREPRPPGRQGRLADVAGNSPRAADASRLRSGARPRRPGGAQSGRAVAGAGRRPGAAHQAAASGALRRPGARKPDRPHGGGARLGAGTHAPGARTGALAARTGASGFAAPRRGYGDVTPCRIALRKFATFLRTVRHPLVGGYSSFVCSLPCTKKADTYTMSDLKTAALDYHALPRPGKLSVELTKPT